MGRTNTALSERDLKVFELIKKFGWIREDFIVKYLGLDWSITNVKNNIYALGVRLSKNGFITKVKIIEGYPAYWSLAKKGAEFMNATEQRPMSLVTLRHNDLVAEVAVEMLVKSPDINLVTEHELKQELFGNEYKNKKLPDLIINENTALEIELSRKNDNKLSLIVAKYLSSNYEKIIYYTNNIGIANRVKYFAKDSNKFTFKLFAGMDILSCKDYIADGSNINNNVPRNNAGQYVNSADEKLRQLGAFD